VIQEDTVNQMKVARSAYDSGQMAGWGTGKSGASDVLYVPLRTAKTTTGILALRPSDPERFRLRDQSTLLESLAKQVALALEVELMSSRRPAPQGRTA